MSITDDLDDVLKRCFGFPEFRPGQREAIETLLETGRLISIQPTGQGKSLLYQLPATLFERITLVISPLLALMRDQIRQLDERFGISAGSINTDQCDDENERVRRDAVAGRLRILFVAPEKLNNLETYGFLLTLPVDLLVVDEAHCISTWGHDFRPAYRLIVKAIHEFEVPRPSLRVLGLTATANQRTEGDIIEQFRSADGCVPTVQRAPMDRPNIALRVLPVSGRDDKLAVLAGLLDGLDGCGILYCATREDTEIVAGYLSNSGHDVVPYHAGLDPDVKRELQLAFTTGKQRVIAATNALGMGIDKPDLRFVIHFGVPGSITSYYQEVGRAGRDGRPALGILLFDEHDRKVQEYFIQSAQPDRNDFEKVLEATEEDDQGGFPTFVAVAVRCGIHRTKINVVLAELVEQGFVEKRLEGQRQVYLRTVQPGVPDLWRYERQLEVRTDELQRMLDYGRCRVACLMEALRVNLGDKEASSCGRCSLCAPQGHQTPVSTEEQREAAWRWDVRRNLPIPASKRPLMAEGTTLLDNEARSSAFVDFMRHHPNSEREQIGDELLAVLQDRVDSLAAIHDFAVVVALPSRTWAQRIAVGEWIAKRLGVPFLADMVVWSDLPAKRQGELLNNDQRRENVKGKMAVSSGALPDGDLLLLDDYHGTVATLREAGRALRKDGGFAQEHDIIPVTIARVRWRLGARGMI